jgi:hypothetical protein
MKTVFIILCITQAITLFCLINQRNVQAGALLNMSNTVSPILSKMAEQLGNYQNIQTSSPAKGGKLIYKREAMGNCISGFGNVYYIRVYQWDYDRNDRLWYRPTHDVSLGCHSCIDEKDVLIPYFDEELQNAEIGVKYYK